VTDELLRHSVRQPRRRTVTVGGEHEGVDVEVDPVSRGASFGPSPVFDQPANGGVVDRHPIGAVRLGRP
jgi:hypothetical protein